MKKLTFIALILFYTLCMAVAQKNPNRFYEDGNPNGNSVQGLYVDSKEGLRARTAPSLNSDKICTFRYGEYVWITEIGEKATIDGLTAPWVRVLINDETGWVFGGYLASECPMSEKELLAYLRKNKALNADYFPKGNGINYMREGSDKWDESSAEYSKSLGNFCCEYNKSERGIIVRDCLFLKDGAASIPPQLRFLKAGSKVVLNRVSGYGIKDKILFPIYSVMLEEKDQSSRNVYGLIRGIDIAGGVNASTVSDGKGGNLWMVYQSALKYVTSSENGTSKKNIDDVLNNCWTYEGAGLRGGYELINVVYFDATGKTFNIPISEFGKISKWISEHVGHTYGNPRIEYPLNMKNPVPFVILYWYYGGQGGGTFGRKIYTLDTTGGRASLNHICDYEYADTDGGPTGMGYHYFTSDGVKTYVFVHECEGITDNMTSCYIQKPSNPYSFVHEESYQHEPYGWSKPLKVGQYVNPNCRLKLRTSPSLNADKINTIRGGTLLKIIEVGKKATIDGVDANWVKVKPVNKAYFVEGYDFTESGWVFGGYLE